MQNKRIYPPNEQKWSLCYPTLLIELENYCGLLNVHHISLGLIFFPCVTGFTHFLSLSGTVKDLIRTSLVFVVIRTAIVQAIKDNWISEVVEDSPR